MKIKSGTLGYAKLNGNWFKSVVVAQERTKLGIRFEPHLHAKLIHFEEFLSEDKFEAVEFYNHTEMPAMQTIWEKMRIKLDYWKRVLRFNKISKMPEPANVKLRTGTVGWAKIQASGRKSMHPIWRRCMVLKKLNDKLKVCCAPDLSIASLAQDRFLVERSIENGLRKLRFIDRLFLKKELRALDVPYRVNERMSFTLETPTDNKGEMNQDLY